MVHRIPFRRSERLSDRPEDFVASFRRFALSVVDGVMV
jgi:hypothetical protein